jgi:hypothetical protein
LVWGEKVRDRNWLIATRAWAARAKTTAPDVAVVASLVADFQQLWRSDEPRLSSEGLLSHGCGALAASGLTWDTPVSDVRCVAARDAV